jgi:ribosomal protein L33
MREKTGAERLFIAKFTPKYNMSVDDPDKQAYDEKHKILIKCLSNIFIDNTINNKDTKEKILFNLFDTDWKNFTCGNVQPTPGKIVTSFMCADLLII